MFVLEAEKHWTCQEPESLFVEVMMVVFEVLNRQGFFAKVISKIHGRVERRVQIIKFKDIGMAI